MTWGSVAGPGPDPRVLITREFPDSVIRVVEMRHERRSCLVVRSSARTGETRLVRVPSSRCTPERFAARIETLGSTLQEQWIQISDAEHAAYIVGDVFGKPSLPELLGAQVKGTWSSPGDGARWWP
jgi:hypothetical protein